MGRWANPREHNAVYRQIVKDGFILTQGTFPLGLEGNPFVGQGERLYFPSFQLLKVHRGHPFRVGDGGRVGVRLAGDKRLRGKVYTDKRPGHYDSVSFFVAPWDVSFTDGRSWRVLSSVLNGFKKIDGESCDASLIYIPQGPEVDGQDVRALSIVPPSQIPNHFDQWLLTLGQAHKYSNHSWVPVGEFDISHGDRRYQAVRDATLLLEKKFRIRMYAQRPLESSI